MRLAKKQKIDQTEAVILPFDVAKANPSKYWQTVNDHLMGGMSTGTSWFTNRDSLNFFGVLRLEKWGRFASIRSAGQELELRDATGISIRVRGDGRTYWVDLHSPRYMNSFRAALKTQKDGETETYIPLSEFNTRVDGFKAQSSGDTASLVEAQNSCINSLGFTSRINKLVNFDWKFCPSRRFIKIKVPSMSQCQLSRALTQTQKRTNVKSRPKERMKLPPVSSSRRSTRSRCMRGSS